MTNEQVERKARFIIAVKSLGIDREELAENIGYKKKYLDQILSAGKNLSDTVALKFTKRYKEINEDWLLHGTGEMHVVENDQITGGTPRTLQDLEDAHRDDPLFALKEVLKDYAERITALEQKVMELQEGSTKVRDVGKE